MAMIPSSKQVGLFLEKRIRDRGPEAVIYYSDLASEFDMPELSENWLAHPLCRILDDLDDEDVAKNQPFRSSFVIAKESNRPGPGFFKALINKRGIRPAPQSDKDRERIWLEEIQAAVMFFQSPQN